MKSINILTTVYLVLALSASLAYSAEELVDSLSSTDARDVRLKRVKRKGGKGRGGSSRGSGSRSKSKVPAADPYPKQPAYNPSYNPGAGAGAYPKQPAQNPGYNPGAGAYPKQPGQTYPGQTGYGQHGYPGQTGHGYPGQGGYGQTGYGQTGYGGNYGLGGNKYGKSKSGLGGLGAGVAGGALGAAVGAYGGYKLGKMVGSLGSMGHYGYYNDRHVFVRCDPPPRIEKDPDTNITYIPRTVTYDARCDYYDREPPRRHPYYYSNGQTALSPALMVTAFYTLLSIVLTMGLNGWVGQWSRPRAGYWLSHT